MRRCNAQNVRARCALVVVFVSGLIATSSRAGEVPPAHATIRIDASRPQGPISPLLYGQFLEYMYGCVKGGLHAELLRDRSFEGPPSAIGLPRYWECYPDSRNDVGTPFARDPAVSYPPDGSTDRTRTGPDHALRVDVRNAPDERYGVYQPGIPVHEGVTYHGYLWIKAGDFHGTVLVALEPDTDAATPHAEVILAGVRGDWKRYDFTLKPTRQRSDQPTDGHFYKVRIMLDEIRSGERLSVD